MARDSLLRPAAGAVLGAVAWPLFRAAAPWLPELPRFLAGWLLFTAGPGLLAAGWIARRLDPLRRWIVVMAAGSAAAPVLIVLLGKAGLIEAFPYLAFALFGAGVARRVRLPAFAEGYGGSTAALRGGGKPDATIEEESAPLQPGVASGQSGVASVFRRTRRDDTTTRGDAIAGLSVAALAAAIGAIVFWYRLSVAPDGILLFGDYDTADLSWYAGVASEASHTIPPQAFYYSGHQLNAAYFAHLVFAMIHRFLDVPILSMFFRFGWPTYNALLALTAFALARSVASTGVAALAVVCIVAGSDFSYLAAWFLPHTNVDWDYLLWPTNFLSPTMEVLHFATWAPSLTVYFGALYTIVRGLQTRARGWLVLSAFLIGILFEFKPFCWVVLMGALIASAVFTRDAFARWRCAATVALGILCSSPFIYGAATLAPADRRTRLVIDYFLLPKRMLIKTDMTKAFFDAAAQWAPAESLRTPLFLFMATVVFLAIGVGVRWIGAAGVWRAIRGGTAEQRLLAWGVVTGIATPFVLTTNPYADTLQFYVAGLYLMWIFTAAALVGLARAHRALGVAAIAGVLALSLPSTVHYLGRKLTDRTRPPRVGLTANELTLAERLRGTDAESTVILHNRPLTPSLTTILSERRIVLGWDVRNSAVGGEPTLREVNRFFASADGDANDALDILRRHKVTHLIVHPQADKVHPAVLERLKLILQLPDVALYEVPPLG